MNRYGWITAALGLSLTGAAHAQQQDYGPGTKKEAGAQEQPDTDTRALQRQEQTDQMQQDTSARLSRVEAQGIQLSALDEDQVKAVQTRLQEVGYYSGTIDGIAGGATRQALSRFYRDQATMASQGMILPQAAAAIGLEEADIERVGGREQQAQPPSGSQPPQQQGEQPQGEEQQPSQGQEQPPHGQQQPSQGQQQQPSQGQQPSQHDSQEPMQDMP